MAQSYHFSLLFLLFAWFSADGVWPRRHLLGWTDRTHSHWRLHSATLWTMEVSRWRLADRSHKPFPAMVRAGL